MHTTVLQYLEKTAIRFPNKIAFADNTQVLTFEQILLNSKKIGSYLAKRVKPHNPIVVYMDKKAYNICAFMGAVYAGCFYVPIDVQMPLDRIKLILNVLNPSMIIYDDVTRYSLDSISDHISKVSYDDAVSSSINNNLLVDVRNNAKTTDILYVLFTSGSTGVPKGVTISNLAVLDFIDWICDSYKLDETTVLCNQAPFYFDASVPDVYISLKTGATVFIPPKSYYTFPKKILQYIDNNHINTLIWVPSALCNVVNCNAFEIIVPSEIRLVIFCGEIMPCKHLNVWKRYIPNALYVNMYGPTEATYACMYYNVDRDFRDDEILPLGRGCENCEIILLTDDNRVACNGEIGEICVMGVCLSQGYYGNNEKTRCSFVQNPTNDKWIELIYRTGDLAYQDNSGNMYFAGRKDHQIKRLGHRIELGEIENTMISISGVDNACCIFNKDNCNIIAFYSGSIDSDSLREVINKYLPNYMVPGKIIKLDNLPFNLNGKIDRIKLRNRYIEI